MDFRISMGASFQSKKLIRAARPFFAARDSLDEVQSISSTTFARGDLSIGRYRRDRPGLGISTPNPAAPVFMAVVILRPRPGHIGWHEGRAVDMPALGSGALACLDLRESWTMDLSDPFDSLHAFIPQTAFDDIALECGLPRIERLNCSPAVERRDETMIALARALTPVLARPQEANRIFTDHIFSAMTIHLAVTYGGLDRGALDARQRAGRLTLRQERHVMNRLRDDLANDLGIAELSSLCGLSRSAFVRAFKQTTGMPPHRWLLLHRAQRARELLERTKMPISEIALECGFADQSHLTRVFSKVFQISPGAWRRQRAD
jgi:AraC family transcriptional regulator